MCSLWHGAQSLGAAHDISPDGRGMHTAARDGAALGMGGPSSRQGRFIAGMYLYLSEYIPEHKYTQNNMDQVGTM